MKRRWDDQSKDVRYSDDEIREMRSGEEVPEMYIALRKIGHDLPPKEILKPILVTQAFREQVIATIRRFYTREQIDRWEKILKVQEEDTKEVIPDGPPTGLFGYPGGHMAYKVTYGARKLPFPIRWSKNIVRFFRKSR